jgi:hypothetical protein
MDSKLNSRSRSLVLLATVLVLAAAAAPGAQRAQVRVTGGLIRGKTLPDGSAHPTTRTTKRDCILRPGLSKPCIASTLPLMCWKKM